MDTSNSTSRSTAEHERRTDRDFRRHALGLSELIDAADNRTKPVRDMFADYRSAAMEVETRFNVLNEQFSTQYDESPIETIKTRVKTLDSLLMKLERKGFPMTIESVEQNIYDVAGVRVICSFVEDIYLLADCLLAQDDVVLVEKRDYIANPKDSGYRSLHLIISIPVFFANEKKDVKVEVQIRTIAMDFWASLEHKLRYKKDFDEERLGDIADELLECADITRNLDLRMQNVRTKMRDARANR